METVTLYDAADATGTKTHALFNGARIMTLYILGTITSFQLDIAFHAGGSKKIPLQGVSISDDTDKASSITDEDKAYQFDVSGMDKIAVDLSSFSGTDITVVAVITK